MTMSDDKPDSGPADNDNGAQATTGGTPSAWAEKGAATELEALRADNADLKDRLLRVMAEMENLRRRTERDKAETAKYAISAFARDVLTVGDNLRRAVDAVPQEALAEDAALKYLLDGVQVTERELSNVLDRHGISRIDPRGERFDPNLHQAMLQVENAEVPSGTVVDVLQAGYVIGDRVLRPALVSVSKGGPRIPQESAAADPGAIIEETGEPGEDDGGGERAGGQDSRTGRRVDRSA